MRMSLVRRQLHQSWAWEGLAFGQDERIDMSLAFCNLLHSGTASSSLSQLGSLLVVDNVRVGLAALQSGHSTRRLPRSCQVGVAESAVSTPA